MSLDTLEANPRTDGAASGQKLVVENIKAEKSLPAPPYSSQVTPHLLNPFLDSIFYTTSPQKAPLKSIIETIGRSHNDFTLIVPPTSVLQAHIDPSSQNNATKSRLYDLCYHNEDFLKSHIIRTSNPFSSNIHNSNGLESRSSASKFNLVIYHTLNGKQIMIKNGQLFPGKGFARSLTLKILKLDFFYSTSTYFPSNSRFMLIFVDSTVWGSSAPPPNYVWTNGQPVVGIPFTKINQIDHKDREVADKQKDLRVLEDSLPKVNETLPVNLTFESLLRSIPLLSKVVSGKFYKLFHHNNYQYKVLRPSSTMNLDEIEKEFYSILQESYTIVLVALEGNTAESETSYNTVNGILKSQPSLDLNNLIHEYVELNLYDKIWHQINNNFQQNCASSKTICDRLSNLSLTQLDITITEPWQLNELYKRILKGIQIFKQLDDLQITNLQGKLNILVKTVEMLTRPSSSPLDVRSIDADTLIGLLIMVVVHSRVPNIEAHLHYIKKFSPSTTYNNGYLSYIISNFDAVVVHLKTSGLANLADLSDANKVLRDLIQNGSTEDLEKYIKGATYDVLESSLNSKTIYGESSIMFAIQSHSLEKLEVLLQVSDDVFSIDDILFDRNVNTNQTLLQVAIIEECHQISECLIKIIEANCSLQEQYSYFNLQDNQGRSLGHYLHHNIGLIDKIGHMIDWEKKDQNSQTPLFSLCRCYDHPQYSILIEKAFSCVKAKHSGIINYDRHEDKNGNSLLHIVQRDLSKTGLLNDPLTSEIDVNQFNYKRLTPLSLYIKYNRIENMREIINDKRLDLRIEDMQFFSTAFDYLIPGKESESNREIQNIITRSIFNFDVLDIKNSPDLKHRVLITHARYDPSKKDWLLQLRSMQKDGSYKIFSLTTESITQFFYIAKLQFPKSILISKEDFFSNFPPGQLVYPVFNRFRVNRLIEDLNVYIQSINFHPKYKEDKFLWQWFEGVERKLTLELVKDVKDRSGSLKDGFEEGKLDISNILEIQFFFNFSLNDLLKFQTVIGQLKNCTQMMDWKLSDLNFAQESLFVKLDIIKKNESLLNLKSNSVYKGLFNYASTLELSIKELVNNIDNVLEKLENWKRFQDQILEYNMELRKYEAFSSSKRPQDGSQGFVEGAVEEDTVASFFNFSSLIENKQTKYKRLVCSKAEVVKQLMQLNAQIKQDHELLASEISSFLKYKSDFFIFALKVIAKSSTRIAAQQISSLNKHLAVFRMDNTAR